MLVDRHYLYNPFLDSNFSFLIQNKVFDENDEIKLGFVVEAIDLFYQPVREPTEGFVFHFCRMILVGVSEFIHVKIWKMLNEENGLVKEVTKLYTITVMVAMPFWALFIASTDFIHPMSEVIGTWYCSAGFALNYFVWNIISYHSFVVAVMRYLFIVHEEKVKDYGKEKAKRNFLLPYLFLALKVVLWGAAERREVDAMSFINKCYGKDHKVFLIDTSSLNIARRNFCENVNYDYNESISGKILSSILRLFCIAKTTIMLLMGFNICEGFIYYKTLAHIYR